MRRLLLAVMAVALVAIGISADTRKVRKMVVYSDNEVKYSGKTAEVDSVKFLLVDENFYNVTVLSGNGTMGSVAGGGEYIEGESATIVATANEGYEFSGWSDGNADNPRTVVVTADMAFVANFREAVTGDGVENGHAWVDLGLPSGLLWATCNVGAENPEDYGNYYAWGETVTKDNYSWSTYKYGSSSSSLTKYNTKSSYGTVDNKTVLDLADDAAYVNWGGRWRMPTDEEITELRENCTLEWTTINGKNGYMVTSTTNGNYIFLPAAGIRYDSGLDYDASFGLYWSSSLDSDYPDYSWDLDFDSLGFGRYDFERCYGFSVRAVCENPVIRQQNFTVTVTTNDITMGSVTGSGTYNGYDRVTIAATANEGYYFSGWSDGNGDNPRTIVVTSDTTIIANFETWPEESGNENNHAYVDLGLPSGLLWATCNVGAESPEESGNYYAWDETETKGDYSWSTYKYSNGDFDENWNFVGTILKYNTKSSYGTVDNKTVLDLGDDAAHVNWGGAWRMPTDAEMTELITNCTTEWTFINGVYGCKVTSNINNNYIFLPAAGVRYDSSLHGDGSDGYYWSSSLDSDYPDAAWRLNFNSSYFYRGVNYRYYGHSVRAVCPAGSN